MSNRYKSTLILAIGLAALPLITAARSARADAYPTQGSQNFHIDGVVTMVDADRDRVTISASDGHQYNLDTDNTQIKLRDTSRPGDTGDLANGMHIDIAGRLLSKDIVAVDRLTVLAYNGPPPSIHDEPAPTDEPDQPAPPPASVRPEAPPVDAYPAPPPTASASGQKIRLRGSVENVDDDTGVVVVRVNSHLRTVVVDHSTDLTDVPSVDDDHIGLHAGDQVTVSGRLRDDGTITASAISLSRNIQTAEREAVPMAPPIDEAPHQLVGRVTHESDRLLSRDIRIRIDGGREVTVHVPHESRVIRDGHPISVHELMGGEVLRVVGSYDDDGFRASRIDVLQEYQGDDSN